MQNFPRDIPDWLSEPPTPQNFPMKPGVRKFVKGLRDFWRGIALCWLAWHTKDVAAPGECARVGTSWGVGV